MGEVHREEKPKDRVETQQEKWARYMRNWRRKDPERTRRLRKIQYNNRKIKALKMVGEVKCGNCGCDELDYLEFNHINGGGAKEFRENIKTRKFMGMADLLLTGKRLPEGLEVLCRVCNAIDFLSRKNNEQSKRYKIKWE